MPADRVMSRYPWLRIRVFGCEMVIPGDCFGGAREMYGRLVYFVPREFEIKHGDVVVDLGSNLGLFALLAAKLDAAQVLAVEAQGAMVPLIRSLLEKNGCADRVAIEWCLVGERTGALSDRAAAERASHWQVQPPTRSMSELLAAHGIKRIDFLKMDIEGSEFDLFQRDCGWLRMVHRIAMEVHPDFGDPAAISSVLSQAGFAVKLARADLTYTDYIERPAGYLYASR